MEIGYFKKPGLGDRSPGLSKHDLFACKKYVEKYHHLSPLDVRKNAGLQSRPRKQVGKEKWGYSGQTIIAFLGRNDYRTAGVCAVND